MPDTDTGAVRRLDVATMRAVRRLDIATMRADAESVLPAITAV